MAIRNHWHHSHQFTTIHNRDPGSERVLSEGILHIHVKGDRKMALFEWNEKIQTGIGEIDEQHKKLIGYINDLHDAMRQAKTKEIMENILDGLFEYTKYHFSFEEKMLEKYDYEKLDDQKKSHVIYVQKIDELAEKHAKNQLGISIDVLNFLLDWIKNHILKDDMQYVPLLKDKIE